MEYKIKVGVIITNEKEEILLLNEKTEKTDKHLWNIVKGTYGDVKSETIFEAAVREGLEEAGVNIALSGLFGCYISLDENEAWTQFTFLAKIVDGNPTLSPKIEQDSRNESISELRWFSKSEIQKMEKNEFISDRIYTIITDWVDGSAYDLTAVKQIKKFLS